MSFEKKGVRGYIYFQNSVFISAPLLNITPNDLKAYIHYLPSKKNSAIPLCKFYKFMPITSASFTAINTANLTSMSLIWSMTPRYIPDNLMIKVPQQVTSHCFSSFDLNLQETFLNPFNVRPLEQLYISYFELLYQTYIQKRYPRLKSFLLWLLLAP